MLNNTLKQRFLLDQAAAVGWLHFGHPFVAELMAAQGFDALVVDHQHAPYGMDTALSLVSAISRTSAVPLVRVSWNDEAEMMKFLDAGALGIICPMVNSALEAQKFVAACRYPPRGIRSFGPTRAALIHGASYAQNADDQILTFAMIETKTGLDDLNSILQTPELDGIFVGPSDLNQSLGHGAKLDSTKPEFLDILESIALKTRNAGKQVGIFCGTPEYALQMQQIGYRFLVLSSDSRLLAASAKTALETFKIGSSQEAGGY
jgi:4-hydroxy-2-oxoheptanedioate aldolase